MDGISKHRATQGSDDDSEANRTVLGDEFNMGGMVEDDRGDGEAVMGEPGWEAEMGGSGDEESEMGGSSDVAEEVDELEETDDDIPLSRMLISGGKGKGRARTPSPLFSAEDEEEENRSQGPPDPKTTAPPVPAYVLGDNEWLADPVVSGVLSLVTIEVYG